MDDKAPAYPGYSAQQGYGMQPGYSGYPPQQTYMPQQPGYPQQSAYPQPTATSVYIQPTPNVVITSGGCPNCGVIINILIFIFIILSSLYYCLSYIIFFSSMAF